MSEVFAFVDSVGSAPASAHAHAPTPIHVGIHRRALEVVGRYKRNECELIEILEDAESHQVYLYHECTSLHQYGVEVLKLSEGVVYNLITVMRAAKKVPELKNEIREGTITLSNAKRIAPLLTPQNQVKWLEKARTLSQRKLEREIVRIYPKSAVVEKASYVTADRVKLEVGLSESDMMRLRRAQDLLSQSRLASVTLEEVIIEMTELYLRQKDPVELAKRVMVKKGFVQKNEAQADSEGESSRKKESSQRESPKNTQLNTPESLVSRPVDLNSSRSSSNSSFSNSSNDSPNDSSNNLFSNSFSKRTAIPAHILHQVNLRDQRRCTHINSTGKTCNQSRWTEIHHIIPVSEGGQHSLENLTTLCSTHHRWLHAKKSAEENPYH